MSSKPQLRVLILAPHVDDEVIGCSSVLRRARDLDLTVVWFEEVTPERMLEGQRVANLLGYKAVTAEHWHERLNLRRGSYDQVYVPSRSDSHFAHKLLNARFSDIATHYYSVDMKNAVPLPEEAQQVKKSLLTFFTSQQKLLDRDDKYWLFEDIRDTDWIEIETLSFGYVTVSVESRLASQVREELGGKVIKEREDHLKAFRWLCGLTTEQVVYSWYTDETDAKNITWRTR